MAKCNALEDNLRKILTELENRMQERIENLEAMCQEQRDGPGHYHMFLKALQNAKAGEEQMLVNMFKTLEAEVLKLNASKLNQAHIQQVKTDVKGMMQDLNQEIRRDHDDKVNHIAISAAAGNDKLEGIVAALENEVMR